MNKFIDIDEVNRKDLISSRILRLPEVKNRVGYSKSSIYRLIAKGNFPQPIKLGDRASGWLEIHIDNWILNKIESCRETSINSKGEQG